MISASVMKGLRWNKKHFLSFQRVSLKYTGFFVSIAFFQPSLSIGQLFHELSFKCCFRCCLIHTNIIILRYLIFTIFLSMFRSRSIYISYLCDLYFIFILIFIMVNRIILWIQTHLLFCLFLMAILMKNVSNFQITKVQPQGVA